MPYRSIPELAIDHDGPVAVVTMNNPDDLNAFTDPMQVAMREVWEHLALDSEVRAIVLTGAGRAFCAGGNIPGFLRDVEDRARRRNTIRQARRLLEAIAECPKPTIAAVNGPAVGLGCSVALCCDLVLMAESTFLADTHVSLGLVAGDGGAAIWPLLTSLSQAKYYLMTGERIPAADCVTLGLANFAVPGDELRDRAVALANRLAEQPQQALEETKRALNLHLQQAILSVIPFSAAAELESFDSEAVRETAASFKKKNSA